MRNGKRPDGEWPEVMTAPMAWRYLHVSRNTLYDKLRRGEIKHGRIGRQYRIAKVELDRRLSGGRGKNSAVVPTSTKSYQRVPNSVPSSTK